MMQTSVAAEPDFAPDPQPFARDLPAPRPAPPRDCDRRVRLVIDLMERELRRELALEEMARHVGLSASRLRHLFKEQTRTTPTQYLKRLRLTVARRRLETTLFSVKEVMASVGVNDPSNFTRDFKRAYGLTPSEFRRACDPAAAFTN